MIGRIAITSEPISSWMTHGRFTSAYVPRIADCGWLMIGVPWNVPKLPGFVIVNVPPWTSSGRSFFVRARSAMSWIARAVPVRLRSCALRMTGTMSPLPSSSATAIPRLTYGRVTML